MFGDSIADSLSYVPDARAILGAGIDLRLELAPCRKLVPTGCVYMGSRPPSVLDVVRASTHAELGDIVVVDVGYNDPPNNYDTDMGTVADALLARGVEHVVWTTMREQSDGYREINAVIRSRAPRERGMEIADWETASRGKPWFNPDGLHLNADGAVGLATLLRPYVLAACGSACVPRTHALPETPRSERAPTLQGTPVVGRMLTCAPGAWSGDRPIVFSYRWVRNGALLAGDVARTHRLGTKDRGKRVACRVWAANAVGASSATSNAVLVRDRS